MKYYLLEEAKHVSTHFTIEVFLFINETYVPQKSVLACYTCKMKNFKRLKVSASAIFLKTYLNDD